MTNRINHTISRAEFAAAIGDIEQGDGMVFHPANQLPVRGKFVAFLDTRSGQPAAAYSVPGHERLALVVLDWLTLYPHVLAWVTREELADENVAKNRRATRRERRHRYRQLASARRDQHHDLPAVA